mmetsp:Transcript_39908/g.65420  ORF Transcript_39908/g.65420 Transcript_39908/m.65420 type:complete len:288 (-) Transcript_39908:1455-2318(-)
MHLFVMQHRIPNSIIQHSIRRAIAIDLRQKESLEAGARNLVHRVVGATASHWSIHRVDALHQFLGEERIRIVHRARGRINIDKVAIVAIATRLIAFDRGGVRGVAITIKQFQLRRIRYAISASAKRLTKQVALTAPLNIGIGAIEFCAPATHRLLAATTDRRRLVAAKCIKHAISVAAHKLLVAHVFNRRRTRVKRLRILLAAIRIVAIATLDAGATGAHLAIIRTRIRCKPFFARTSSTAIATQSLAAITVAIIMHKHSGSVVQAISQILRTLLQKRGFQCGIARV